MTATTPTWLPERRKQVWEIGLYTGVALGFSFALILTSLAGIAFEAQYAPNPVISGIYGLVILGLAAIMIALFRRDNRGGEQA